MSKHDKGGVHSNTRGAQTPTGVSALQGTTTTPRSSYASRLNQDPRRVAASPESVSRVAEEQSVSQASSSRVSDSPSTGLSPQSSQVLRREDSAFASHTGTFVPQRGASEGQGGTSVVVGSGRRAPNQTLTSLPRVEAVDDGAARPVGKPAISFIHVSKVYPSQPNKPALGDVTLDIHEGEFVFLVGQSGSGKSTFIRLLNRELVATSGQIFIGGTNLVTMRNWGIPKLRRNVGCVFQDFKLLPNKTTFENVSFALEVIGKPRAVIKTQVPEVLRLVGLYEKMDQMPDQLSGGEQQRVSIARAIVNRPPYLICDEPTGNLDPQTSLGIMRLLERINRTRTTVIVATHDREMVDNMRRRVIELENGRLVRDQDQGVYGFDV